jgi:hypothetical protein
MGSSVRRVKRECVPDGEFQLERRPRMTYRIAFPLLALLVAGGCSAKDATAPMSQTKSPGASAALQAADNDGATSPRSGALHVTKECSEYTGAAGSFCTITSSNLKAIEVGSRVVYAEAPVAGVLDTDIILDPPGPGNNIAFGHVFLDFRLNPPSGTATFSGGTGKFRGFHASVAVSFLGGFDWAWDGTYSFSKNGED